MKGTSDKDPVQLRESDCSEVQQQDTHRHIPNEQLQQILKEHEKWLDSEFKTGTRADLSHAQLCDVDLAGINLAMANLEGANLHSADLRDADLSEAILTSANLQEVDLRGANLQGAKLSNAEGLADARWNNANLENVSGLRAADLARADLTGATIPREIANFRTLDVVEEVSKNSRKIYISMLAGCAYSWLTIATTTDVDLITNSAASPLPIIQTRVPIVSFYWVAPVVLLLIYFYLHFNLRRLWIALATLPALFPDGRPLDQFAYPWLLTGLPRRYFKHLENRPAIDHLEELIVVFLAWWLTPLTVMGLWLRLLPRHDIWGTGFQVGLIIVSVWGALYLYRSASEILRGEETEPFTNRAWLRGKRIRQPIGVGIVGAACLFLSHAAISGTFPFMFLGNGRLYSEEAILKNPWTWLPEPLGFFLSVANLVDEEISTKPIDFRHLTSAEQVKAVRGAKLGHANLRYATALGVFLVNADLGRANLEGALLMDSDLRGASLPFANLKLAILTDADLSGANLSWAYLRWAEMNGANLEGADFSYANLSEAILLGANLRDVNFKRAKLQGSWFIVDKVIGEGPDLLLGAQNLTQEQLDQACGDSRTRLPPGLTIEPCSEEDLFLDHEPK